MARGRLERNNFGSHRGFLAGFRVVRRSGCVRAPWPSPAFIVRPALLPSCGSDALEDLIEDVEKRIA